VSVETVGVVAVDVGVDDDGVGVVGVGGEVGAAAGVDGAPHGGGKHERTLWNLLLRSCGGRLRCLRSSHEHRGRPSGTSPTGCAGGGCAGGWPARRTNFGFVLAKEYDSSGRVWPLAFAALLY